jgi:hypothetical protein
VAAVLALALGISATTATFSVLDRVSCARFHIRSRIGWRWCGK